MELAPPFYVICHFFLSCIHPNHIPFPSVPPPCKGLLAPPEVLDELETRTLITVLCSAQRVELGRFGSHNYKFNTLQYSDIKYAESWPGRFFDAMSIVSLVFYNVVHENGYYLPLFTSEFFDGMKLDMKAITFIECELYDIEWDAFHKLVNLELIHIESTRLDTIPSQLDHSSFHKVKMARFQSSSVSNVSPGVFNKWDALEILVISDCDISSIDWLNGKYNNLWHLDLSINKMTSLRENILTKENFPVLTFLNLNDNKLLHFGPNALPQTLWPQLKEVYMNRLCCNNQLKWLRDILEKREITFDWVCYLPAKEIDPQKPSKYFINRVKLSNFDISDDCPMQI